MATTQEQAKEISVIVTTYNSPQYLQLVLEALRHQAVQPREVIIADDGSTLPTKQLIDRYRKLFTVPLIHSWIPDQGFRAAKSRNAAIAKATGTYIILLDGDMLVTRHFIEDHLRMMEKGCYINGSRAYLTEKATRKRLKQGNWRISFFSPGFRNRRLVMLRCPLLHWLFRHNQSRHKHIHTCHIAFWKADCIRINGFDERFVGWGSEDTDFGHRLEQAGLTMRKSKFLAPAAHLWHPTCSRAEREKNKELGKTIKAAGNIRALIGIDQYLHLPTPASKQGNTASARENSAVSK